MKKDTVSTVILIIVFLLGLCLLLYPSFSNYWNSFTQSKVVVDYAENVANLDNELYDELLASAHAYNAAILEKENPYLITEEDMKNYESQLNLSGVGVLGYIEIPAIDCSLPIYHSVRESVLQIAVGHIEWSSLPVGGPSTHAVLSGHRGLPSAKLFSDLDALVVGDTFIIRVLDETLTYEVDQILIVEPQDVDALTIVEGQDYCSLVTCTPYGVNTHRILVRGHRITNTKEAREIRVTADAIQIDPLLMTPLVAAPMLLLLLLWLLFTPPKKKE